MSESVAVAQLREIVDRLRKLREQALCLEDDEREILRQAKKLGFDKKAIRRLVGRMMMDPAERREDDAIYELYAKAIGFS